LCPLLLSRAKRNAANVRTEATPSTAVHRGIHACRPPTTLTHAGISGRTAPPDEVGGNVARHIPCISTSRGWKQQSLCNVVRATASQNVHSRRRLLPIRAPSGTTVTQCSKIIRFVGFEPMGPGFEGVREPSAKSGAMSQESDKFGMTGHRSVLQLSFAFCRRSFARCLCRIMFCSLQFRVLSSLSTELTTAGSKRQSCSRCGVTSLMDGLPRPGYPHGWRPGLMMTCSRRALRRAERMYKHLRRPPLPSCNTLDPRPCSQ
jgi:hypothetical protein